MKWPLRLLAKALLLITALIALGELQEYRWPLGSLGAYVVVMIVTWFSVLAHELAHAAAARWQGADVVKIVALPVEWQIKPRRLRFVSKGGRGDVGGYVAYRLDRVGAHRRHAIIAAAGPAGSIVFGIAAGFLAAWLDTGRRDEPIALIVAGAFMIVSIGMGIANLIPFDQSDGMHLWQYFRRLRLR